MAAGVGGSFGVVDSIATGIAFGTTIVLSMFSRLYGVFFYRVSSADIQVGAYYDGGIIYDLATSAMSVNRAGLGSFVSQWIGAYCADRVITPPCGFWGVILFSLNGLALTLLVLKIFTGGWGLAFSFSCFTLITRFLC